MHLTLCVFAVRRRAAPGPETPGGLHVFVGGNPGGAVCCAHSHPEIVSVFVKFAHMHAQKTHIF